MKNMEETVYLIDDEVLVRDSLGLMIQEEGYKVQAFHSAEAFLAVYQPYAAGCIITDINMPLMNGIKLQEELLDRGFSPPIIFLTGHGSIQSSVKTLKSGAFDFLTKPIKKSQLIVVIDAAFLKNREMLAKAEVQKNANYQLSKLTNREKEVLFSATTGNPNKVIARELGISHRTVEIHKSRILNKTGAKNLVDLLGLVQVFSTNLMQG